MKSHSTADKAATDLSNRKPQNVEIHRLIGQQHVENEAASEIANDESIDW